MPELEVLSAVNRTLVYEISNIDDEKAVEYLVDNDIAEDNAKEILHYVGGENSTTRKLCVRACVCLCLCVSSYVYVVAM